MKEEIKQVLEMLKDEKISSEEAIELIEALKATETAETSNNEQENTATTGRIKKLIRINVIRDGKQVVNIKVPFSLVKWGINIADKIGKDNIKIGEEGIPLNLSELTSAINDPELYGKILDVHDEERNEHVQIEIV